MNIDWFKSIDSYCERLGLEFWAEPLNALSNIFMFAAGVAGFYLVSRLRKKPQNKNTIGHNWIYALSFAACLTGVGSFLFHTYANFITLWGDIIPIMIFMEIFLAFTLREIFGRQWWSVILAMLLFLGIGFFLQTTLPKDLLNGSLTYSHAVLVLLVITGALFGMQKKELAQRYAACFIVFFTSLIFRTVDHAVCESWPFGTHFIWHALNGLLLLLLIKTAVFHSEKQA